MNRPCLPTPQDDLTGLGRRHAPDPRDKAYRLMAAAPPRGVRRKTHYVRGVLDQGPTSMCVAYSGAKYLECHPVKNKLNMPIPVLYRECQRNDEWTGEDYDGTSVRALFKVLKREGFISEYRWARDVDTMVNHVLSTGPVEMGTDWYMGMMASTRDDFLIPDGELAGGHAYLVIGVDIDAKADHRPGEKGAFTMLNSWGYGWSKNGRAKIAFSDMQKLLDASGEACVATEIVRAA